MKHKPNRLQAIPMPGAWKENFRSHTLRTSFVLTLSRTMLEFLCAVSDDVAWDRSHFPCQAVPDGWLAAEASLVKRGLIIRKNPEARLKVLQSDGIGQFFQVTPAGEKVVELLKITGLFVAADDAIGKKKRG